jgi:hypothetical protein
MASRVLLSSKKPAYRGRVRMEEIEGQESAGKMKVKRHTGTTQGREK